MSGSSGYATIDDLPVYYELHGEALTGHKTPMVLLHGGLMTIETGFMEDLIPRFERTRPVIAIEQQGHGHTGDRGEPVTVRRMVEDTAGVLAHLDVKQADFFGHSLGGMIAMGLAIHHASLVRNVISVSSFYSLDGMLPELVKLQRDPTHQPSAELMQLLPTEADFAAMRQSFLRYAPDPAAWEPIVAKVNTMLSEWEGWTNAELQTVQAPVLVAIGDNDFTRIEHAAEMARLIPRAQLAVLPGTTHMSILKRGDWIIPMVEALMTLAED